MSAHYNTNEEPLKGLRSSLGNPPNLQIIKADLSNESDVVDMFATLSQRAFGPVIVAIVNHGHWPQADAPLVKMSLNQWNSTLSTNLTSSFLVCREYLKKLESAGAEAKDKASIVFIGSTAGKYGEAGHADYAATKSGERSHPVYFES